MKDTHAAYTVLPENNILLYTKEEAITYIRNNLDLEGRPTLNKLPTGFMYSYYAYTDTYDFYYYNIFVARFRRGCHIYGY